MSELASSIAALHELRRELVLGASARLGRRPRIGFVPTMGALHEGHASLLGRMRQECDVCIASVFVNPSQFGPGEDFDKYPRTLEADLALCSEQGCDLVFAPSADEIYPQGFQSKVSLPQLSARWCGASRPGHFDGVATVVLKLLELTRPDVAFFGEKDYQQLRIIQQMTWELNVPCEIVGCPTVREADGLALSSRNQYLGPAEREAAPQLYRVLQSIQRHFAAGETSAARLTEDALKLLSWTEGGSPLWQVEYLAIVDPASLEPVQSVRGGERVLVAARLGGTRLIDNLELRH